jgi:hypothetical protein
MGTYAPDHLLAALSDAALDTENTLHAPLDDLHDGDTR